MKRVYRQVDGAAAADLLQQSGVFERPATVLPRSRDRSIRRPAAYHFTLSARFHRGTMHSFSLASLGFGTRGRNDTNRK